MRNDTDRKKILLGLAGALCMAGCLLADMPHLLYAAEPSDAEPTEIIQETPVSEEESVGEGTTYITMVGRYDSADTAPVVRINEQANTITLRNHDTGRNYTLEYDAATRFIDAYGMETQVGVLESGVLVDVTFLKSTKHLNSLKVSAGGDVWHYTDQRNYTMPVKLSTAGPSVSSMATIAGQRYLMDVRALVLADGKEARTSAIVDGDLISVWGVGNDIYSVKVTKGHGYVRLSSDTVNGTSLVGAWIEIGNSVIRKITPRMLVTAPEGDYTLYIVGNGANYSTDISIARGEETLVDTSVIPIAAQKEGKVRFSLKPANARIRIDDKLLAEGEDTVTLPYGIHTLELTAEGYDTMFRYLRVGRASAVLQMEMERSAASTEASSAASTENTTKPNGTTSGTNNTTDSTNSGSGNTAGNNTSNNSTSNNSGTNNGGTGNTTSNGGSSQTDNGGNTTSAGNSSTSQIGDTSGNTGTTPQSDNTGNGVASGVMQSGRIFVDSPSGASFYLDGNFIGFVPVNFEKTSGIHTVTFSQEGKRTVSYNIEIGSGPGDINFQFPAMEPE